MKKLFTGVALFCLLPITANAGEVYTWIDEHGVKHFSDSPPAHAAEGTVTERSFNSQGSTTREEYEQRMQRYRDESAANRLRIEREAEERRAEREQAWKEQRKRQLESWIKNAEAREVDARQDTYKMQTHSGRDWAKERRGDAEAEIERYKDELRELKR